MLVAVQVSSLHSLPFDLTLSLEGVGNLPLTVIYSS